MAAGLIVPPGAIAGMSVESGELELLSKAESHPTKCLQLPFGILQPHNQQVALVNCTMAGWLRLIDINMVQNPDPRQSSNPNMSVIPARVFQLTPTGEQRLSMIRKKNAS
jgi:hypothetical protein